MSVVEFTREVEYCCPSFITYIVRSKSELLEDGSFTGNRFSVLPSHRCQPTVIEYSSDGELFVFQQEISIILQKSSGESFSSMDITYRASKISFSPNIWPDFYLLMACSYQKVRVIMLTGYFELFSFKLRGKFKFGVFQKMVIILNKLFSWDLI